MHAWIWASIPLVALLFRLYRLTTLSHFLNQMAILKAQQGDSKSARPLYQQAMRCPINYTQAYRNLYRLEHPEIQTPHPKSK